MKIGEKLEGTVVKITIGRDGCEYITLEFDGFGLVKVTKIRRGIKGEKHESD